MTINETIELLQSRVKGELVRKSQFINNDTGRYILSLDNKDVCCILTSNDRVVALYDYVRDKFTIECSSVDRNGVAHGGITRETTRHINDFIKKMCIEVQHTSYVPKIKNLVYFDYYYQHNKDKLKDLL